MSQSTLIKDIPKLSLGEKLDIIKNKRFFPIVFPLAILVVIIAIFAILTGGAFLAPSVFTSSFDQSLIVGTMATAVAFIYSTGNIDFSVGNAMGLAAVFGALVYQVVPDMTITMIVILISGVALMMFNCTLSVFLNIKAVMVAIVAMSIYNALTIVLVGADPYRLDYNACKALEGDFRYIAFILYFGGCILFYHRTAIGRKLRFIGGNENCAKQTGINSKRSQYIAFLFAGIGVGLAGIFQTLRTASVAQSVGAGMGMDVMLATVLGGMSIFGGMKSRAYAGFIGAITVVLLNKGLLMVGVSSTLIQGARGIVFLLLVFLNSERESTLPTKEQF